MKTKAVLIAAAALVCLTACGNSDSSSGAEGIVTIQTSTTAAATTTTATPTPATTTTASETDAKKTETTTKKTTSEKKTELTETKTEATVSETTTTTVTQATQPPVQTTPSQTTPAPDPEPSGPDLSTLRGKAMVNYKGFIFGVGENINDIKGKLGKESAPMQEAPNCLTGEKSPIYFYEGMEIETTYSGKIFTIRMGTQVMYPGDNVETAGGARIGDGESALSAALGNPTTQDV